MQLRDWCRYWDNVMQLPRTRLESFQKQSFSQQLQRQSRRLSSLPVCGESCPQATCWWQQPWNSPWEVTDGRTWCCHAAPARGWAVLFWLATCTEPRCYLAEVFEFKFKCTLPAVVRFSNEQSLPKAASFDLQQLIKTSQLCHPDNMDINVRC